MVERVSEIQFLEPRNTQIQDETLESYVLQLNKGEKDPNILSYYLPIKPTINGLRRLAQLGVSFQVAAGIAAFEIPDEQAKELLAQALENNVKYFRNQPMYFRIKEEFERECLWMKNAAKRLRGEQI